MKTPGEWRNALEWGIRNGSHGMNATVDDGIRRIQADALKDIAQMACHCETHGYCAVCRARKLVKGLGESS